MVQAEYKFIYLDQWCKTQWKYLKEKYRREKKVELSFWQCSQFP